jgi:hypothetical protein
MNKYLAAVRVGGSTIRTMVFADSDIHARLLLQYQYGMNSIVISPSLTKEAEEDDRLVDNTIKPIKPLTPAQTRIQGLKHSVDRTREALRAEQERQRQQREAERTRKQQAQPTTG